MKKFILVTDAGPAEVEAKTGLHGHPTPLGTLIEDPEPPDIGRMMERLDRALRPPRICNCSIVHMPPCRLAFAVT